MIGSRAHPLVASLALLALAAPVPAVGVEETALLPLQVRVRDAAVGAIVERALEDQLGAFGPLLGPEQSRSALRRLRLRDLDAASPETLARLGSELGVGRIVAATLHDLPIHAVPDLSLSIRFYDRSGALIWSGFEGRSGLDGRRLLGLGVRETPDQVAPELVRRLLAAAPPAEPAGRGVSTAKATFALVPITAQVEHDALVVAETATEATRSLLGGAGIPLAPPGCVRQALRSRAAPAWGALDAAAREEVRTRCGAERIVTGAVERWGLTGSGLEPEPDIALSLRLLDAATGRILWMGSEEALGWQGGGLFGLRRVFSRGALLKRVLAGLIDDLLKADGTTRQTGA